MQDFAGRDRVNAAFYVKKCSPPKLKSRPRRSTAASTFYNDAADVKNLDERMAVLVVDDNPAQRATAVDILQVLGCKVYDAYNGRDALRLLDLHPEIGLLFADIRMPGMTGEELAEAAMRIRPDVKIVLTSGFVDRVTVEGANFVPKPYRLDDLARMLGQATSTAN
jgi:CheY-like chemotaxis protein